MNRIDMEARRSIEGDWIGMQVVVCIVGVIVHTYGLGAHMNSYGITCRSEAIELHEDNKMR